MRRAFSYRVVATGFLLAATSVACSHPVLRAQSVADMDRARLGPDVKDAATLAPQEYAHAEEERALSQKAFAAGDVESSDLYAERAVVAYERAVVLARLARATDEEAAARTKLAIEEREAQRLAAAKVPFEAEATALANELAVAREALAPVRVGPADATRERARLVAATSLLAEAHLLCGAARLLTRGTTPAPGDADAALLGASEEKVTTLEGTLGKPTAPKATEPIELAARARADCLSALTHERRVNGGTSTGAADALLSALSSHGGWDPSRDERGVVVTLRGAFKGTTLTADGEKQLRDLGHVAGANAAFPLQVVLHDATAPDKSETAADLTRVRAAVSALTAGGAGASQAFTETVGARLPRTDPADASTRGHNARLEVVFVSRSD